MKEVLAAAEKFEQQCMRAAEKEQRKAREDADAAASRSQEPFQVVFVGFIKKHKY